MTLAQHHIDQIKTLLGPKDWKQQETDIAPFLQEWRDRWQGHTPLVALPGSTEKTAELVAYCAQHQIKITPQGGNTGLVGGQTPQGELLLSTKRLNRITKLNAQNSTLTLGAGVTLAEARAKAHETGLLFPLSLASEGSASIGGVLSTNAGGMEVLRYGNARDLTLGLEVVTPKGEILSTLKGLRKDNSGYDLKQLFIGAEGTLGVITAAVLKLYPVPPIRLSAWCALDSVHSAVALLAFIRKNYGDALCKFELISQLCVDIAVKNLPNTRNPIKSPATWHVMLELGLFGPLSGGNALETVLAGALQSGLIQDAVIAQSGTQAAQFLDLREGLSAAQKAEGQSIKHDISVPLSAIADFMTKATDAVLRIAPKARIFAFGHVGDGNVHFNILQPLATTSQDFSQKAADITEAVYHCVHEHGGSISAEHGIGILKKTELDHQKSAVEMQIMRSIKAALDPDNIMNPRVLF